MLAHPHQLWGTRILYGPLHESGSKIAAGGSSQRVLFPCSAALGTLQNNLVKEFPILCNALIPLYPFQNSSKEMRSETRAESSVRLLHLCNAIPVRILPSPLRWQQKTEFYSRAQPPLAAPMAAGSSSARSLPPDRAQMIRRSEVRPGSMRGCHSAKSARSFTMYLAPPVSPLSCIAGKRTNFPRS